ncbi:MAG TPA: hypothetical protein EYN79_03755 [Planctomycetes bacterium]|nr:hypothetical protein [Planctomycetota bacterium]
MPLPLVILSSLMLVLPIEGTAVAAKPLELAGRYVRAITQINEQHARKSGSRSEANLARNLPKSARKALTDLLKMKPDVAQLADALVQAAQGSLELALIDDFQRIRQRLRTIDNDRALAIGVARASERVLYLGENGLDEAYLVEFARVFEAVLDGYREVFGFREWSKVPGKKLRLRIHLEGAITRAPHFAPQFPYHSEIDFPVIDGESFTSPTARGHFLFYGLCHELGHVIAMWGDRNLEQDRHAWAHYTGVVIVDHIASTRSGEKWIGQLRDQRWRSLERLRAEVAGKTPSLADRDGVLALFLTLHDAAGPQAIGAAINAIDRSGKTTRINRVRYYRMEAFRLALLSVVRDRSKQRTVAETFARAGIR